MPDSTHAGPAKLGLDLEPGAIERAIGVPLAAGLREVGEVEEQHIKAALNVPVVWNGAGKVIQRSRPGEPPRKEASTLQFHVAHDVVANGDGGLPELTITSHRPPNPPGTSESEEDPDAARKLEYGHAGAAARPYMRPAVERLRGYAAELVANAIRRGLPP